MAETPTKTNINDSGDKTPSKGGYNLSGYFHKIQSPTNSEERVAFTIQGKRKSQRVLCYAPEKIAHLKDATAINVFGCKQGRNEDFYMSHATTVEEGSDLDYECIDKTKVKINMLPKLAKGDLLTIVAQVKIVQPVKTVKKDLKVQDLSVSDSTAAIRLALWKSLVDKCVKGGTYTFVNFRLVAEKNGTLFLQSTKDEGTKIEEGEQMMDAVDGALVLNNNNRKQIRGEFVGIDTVFSYKKCVLCGKKSGDNIPSPAKVKVVNCANCGKPVKLKACPFSVVVNAKYQDAETKDITHCTMFTEVVMVLLDMSAEDLAALEKQKLEYAIIEVDETIITLNKSDIVTQVTHV